MSVRKLVFLAGTAAASAQAATAEFFMYASAGDNVDLVVLADGKEVCAIRIDGATEDAYRKVACRFAWPSSAATLTVRGSYDGTDGSTNKRFRHEGTKSWSIVDFGPVGAQLLPADTPYGERLANFVKRANEFARERLGEDIERIEAGAKADARDIDAAEKRLGYALPREFTSILRVVGALRLEGDHFLTAARDINDADSQIRTLWGTPEEAMDEEYSPAQRKALRASTLLFTEAGDAYGGLRYLPAPNKVCGERPFYQWISQEGGNPKLLRPDLGCMDFGEAFRWVLEGFLLDGYADSLSSNTGGLLVDTSQESMPFVVQMDRDRFDISLAVRWQGPNGYWRVPVRAD